MKHKLKSSYPCLVKTNNEAFDIDENDILEIEGEERLFIYPLSYSRRNIPFYINLNDLKDCDKFSVFDIDDDILIFLNKTERVRSFAKESLSFNDDKCDISISENVLRFENKNAIIEYELERAELVLYLPSTWNINSSQEEDYWPIRQLKILARLPIECHTWLGYGHTISSDEENTPYANNTQFCSMMLVDALDNQGENLDLRMKSKGKINFYQLFPLYKEELEYKQKKNAESLLNLFDDEDLMPIVNIHRRNYG